MTPDPRNQLPTKTVTSGRRPLNEIGMVNGSSNQSTSTHSTLTGSAAHTSSGLGRVPSSRTSGSPMSARAAARKPVGRGAAASGGSPSLSGPISDDNARAEHAQLVEDLRQQVQKADMTSDHHQKEFELARMRLNAVTERRDSLEDLIAQKDADIEAAQSSTKEIMRQKQELEQAHQAEKNMLLTEREDQRRKERELQNVVQRLNETIRQKEVRAHAEKDGSGGVLRPTNSHSPGSAELNSGQLTPSSPLERSPSRNNSKLLLQKDRMIETLRMELAEVQIKLAEMEHVGDGRLQIIEKKMMDTKMANARLMEDNESFQLLLSEKTLKGDFMHDIQVNTASRNGTLADELESAGDGGEGESSEAYRKLELELRSSRESNKALTLYVDKIIGRLLQHEGFEHIIHDKDEPASAQLKPTDKALPPPPPAEELGSSFLQRAKSVVSGRGGRPVTRSRPMSYMPAAAIETAPTAHENPDTAPSIPLSRGSHRRSPSNHATEAAAAASSVSAPVSAPVLTSAVSQLHRGSPLRPGSGGRASPEVDSLVGASISSSHPGFVQSNPAGSRIASSSGPVTAGRSSRTNSILSVQSGEANSQDPSSPPRDKQGANALPGAVMKQSQLRPLRLVRERTLAEEDEFARKKANRGSWMPAWFNRVNGMEGHSAPILQL